MIILPGMNPELKDTPEVARAMIDWILRWYPGLQDEPPTNWNQEKEFYFRDPHGLQHGPITYAAFNKEKRRLMRILQ